MKNYSILLLSVLTLSFGSCSLTKNDTSSSSELSDTSWELEQIATGKTESLFPNKKPQLTFNKATNHVSGNSGCNGYSSKYTVKNKSITFSDSSMSTMMFCDGEGEQIFKQKIKEVNNYFIDKENKLNLNIDKTSVMRFKKISK